MLFLSAGLSEKESGTGISICRFVNPVDHAAMCLKELIQGSVTALNEVKIGTLYFTS